VLRPAWDIPLTQAELAELGPVSALWGQIDNLLDLHAMAMLKKNDSTKIDMQKKHSDQRMTDRVVGMRVRNFLHTVDISQLCVTSI
jgi:hypothetical protein